MSGGLAPAHPQNQGHLPAANAKPSKESGMKYIVGIVLGILVVIFAAQNGEVVDVTFFFWTVSVSRAVMLIGVFLIGLFGGWVLTSLARRRKRKRVADSS